MNSRGLTIVAITGLVMLTLVASVAFVEEGGFAALLCWLELAC